MADTFSTERAGFAERLGRLAGGTTYREPMEGHSTAGCHMPEAHSLATALAFAGRGNGDVGPDLALAVVLQRLVKPERVVPWLASELSKYGGRMADKNADFLPNLSRVAYVAVIQGGDPAEVEGVDERAHLWLSSLAMSLIWGEVGEAIWRAERAYRAES